MKAAEPGLGMAGKAWGGAPSVPVPKEQQHGESSGDGQVKSDLTLKGRTTGGLVSKRGRVLRPDGNHVNKTIC